MRLASTEAILARAVRGRTVSAFEKRLIDVLHDDVFRRVEDLRPTEQCALTYRRMLHLNERLGLRTDELFGDLDKLLALHDWTSLIDGTLTTLLTIHFNLCIGSILQHGNGRPELVPFLEELERLDTVGTFMATELGYGNNVQALETSATFDAATRDFVIHTPSVAAQKFMPNTGAEGIAKLAVVMARLRVDGQDCGVFPFVVRIRTNDALCDGVNVIALGDKPDFPLDNAITSFDDVRIPFHQWLSGAGSRIDEEGVFSSDVGSRRKRFLTSMERVQAGKLCLSVAGLSMLRGTLRLALGYSQQRKTFAPGAADVSILSYRPQQRAIFEGVATSYACAFFLEDVANAYRSRPADDDVEVNRILALGKVFVSSRATRIMSICRERIGAQGLFCANRIVTYWVHTNGIVTAEGDNEVLIIKSARELLLSSAYTPPSDSRVASHLPLLESTDYLVSLARERERRLHEHLSQSIGAAMATSSLFDVWNGHLTEATELVAVHTARLVLESFNRALDQVEDTTARDVLERLMRLFALQELASSIGALLADGVLERDTAAQIGAERDRLAAELFPHAALLTEAFGIPMSLLDAPIGDSYLEAYEQLSSWPVPRTSLIRARHDGAAEPVTSVASAGGDRRR
ncbi:MAG TPA: acyl-CoA dehydrogenase [Polyangiaceae bacterium]|nr:acyl-CoA dehydrogenase [Polyangiaceae bacterium]